MTTPTHVCPRCARTSTDEGACPRGHGWLLDLADEDDRAELSSHVAHMRAPRAWGAEMGHWLAFELMLALVIFGIALQDWGMSWSNLTSSSPGLLLVLGASALLLLWLRRGPRALRARRIEALLTRTRLANRLPAAQPTRVIEAPVRLRVVAGDA